MFKKLKRNTKEKQTEWSKYDDKVIQAVESGDTTKLQTALTKKGTSPSKAGKDGRTALHVAAQTGQFPSLEIMLALGANLNARDEQGHTALHLAARGGHLNSANRLIQAGTPLNTKDSSGKTPLHHAASEGHVECTILFLQSLADKEAKDEHNKTALLWASELGHVTVCKELIDRGANVNTQDNKMRTPLIQACQNNRKEVVDLLVKRGARADLTDSTGHDATFYASEAVNPDLKKSLEAAPSVATWDVKTEEEEVEEPKPDAVDYIDAFDANLERSDSLEPIKKDAKPTLPSRAISMPSLAMRENEDMKDIQELEEENDMLNEELQKVSVNHRKAVERIKELELELQQNDIATLQAMLDEEKKKNLQATQEIETLKKSQKVYLKTVEEGEGDSETGDEDRGPDSWADSDDDGDDLFDLPGLGPRKAKAKSFSVSPTTKLSALPSSNKYKEELAKLREENEELKSKMEAFSKSSQDSQRMAELESEIRELKQKEASNANKTTNQEPASLQQELTFQKEKLAGLISKVSVISEERDKLKTQLEGRMSPNSPRYLQLLQDKKDLEESVKNKEELLKEKDAQIAKLQRPVSSTPTTNENTEGGKWRGKYEELLKENTRCQTTITKQSKAIAQQTDRSRKDKQKYSSLLAEKEQLEKEIETLKNSSGAPPGSNGVLLLAECEKLREKVKVLESEVESHNEEKDELESVMSENSSLKSQMKELEETEAKALKNANSNLNFVEKEEMTKEIVRIKEENNRLKWQPVRQRKMSQSNSTNDKAFSDLTVENENLKKTLSLQKEELDALRESQSTFTRKRYSELLLENRKLKESLPHSLPNGNVKTASRNPPDSSKAEVERLKTRLEEVEKKLNGTVAVYRQHLLNAVQNNMDPQVRQALLQIVKLRATNGGTC